MDKKSYIKEHSWSGLKSGIKYSSYVYLGATIASLLISLAVVPIFPFTLLISNPVAWAVLGVAFVGLSAAAVSVAKPLFHWAKDSINQKKVEKQEGKGREKVVDGNEKQPEPVLNVETESLDSVNQRKTRKKKKAISNYKTSDSKLDIRITTRLDKAYKEGHVVSFLESSVSYSNFMEQTNQKDYQCWLDYSDIVYIAYNAYGYLPSQIKNDVYFFVCKPEFVSGRNPDHDQKGRFFSNGKLLTDRELALELRDYKETVKRKPGLVFTSIINVSDHYVTLVVAYDSKNKNFRAYYCSSFDSPYNQIDQKLPEYLEKEFHLKKEDIEIRYTGQQKDSSNCGIYVLENAKKITDMMKAGRSLAKIDKELAKYQPSKEELKNKRIEFAKSIEEDQDWERGDIDYDKYPPLSFMAVPEISGGSRLRGCY